MAGIRSPAGGARSAQGASEPPPAAGLERYHHALRAHFGRQMDLDGWWPGGGGFETVAGAILVQNTAWTNAARALAALRAAGRLSPSGVRGLSEDELGALIRSSGCWRQKARRLRGLVEWLEAAHGGSLERLFAQPTAVARAQLLALDGIGEETADTILLFAGGHATFIVDAYTRRIFARHRLSADRARIAASLPADARGYRHLHALLVETGKRYCRKREPDCRLCPLAGLLPAAGAA